METHKIEYSNSNFTEFPVKKILTFNGYSAIQTCSTNRYWSGTIFLEEDMLLIVKEGSLLFRYGNTVYEVCKNQMAFLKKDIFITLETPNSPNCILEVEYILFSLRYDLVKEFVKLAELSIATHNNSIAITVNTLDKRLEKYVDTLDFYFVEPDKIEGSLVKIKLLELLFYLSLQGNEVVEQLLDVRDCFRSNITAVVEENIMNSLSLHQLAVKSGRSLSSFRRDFQAIYNMPPSHYIRQKRLEKARQLLLSTTMSVTDVCYVTGFESIAHFSRLFRSYCGCSPSEFRHKTQQDESPLGEKTIFETDN
jgi:AraC-like DNA-binding protein